MSRIFTLLGKTGDLIAALPIFKAESEKEGRPTRVIVSKDYSAVLEGCSYVEPVIHEGPASELEQAMARGRSLAETVSLQLAGEPEVVNRITMQGRKQPSTGSFVKEMYHLAGWGGLWETQPVAVFDRRDAEREEQLIESLNLAKGDYRQKKVFAEKIILLAVDGKNAPFHYKALLLELLKGRFPKRHRIIDLADLKAHRIFDLLSLYERAHVLIASDSAPLHLAYAVPKLPVVALINERPLLWNGSPWRSQHIFHCRYSSFASRAVDMLDTIENLHNAGQPFGANSSASPKLVHVWSQYEEKDVSAHRRWEARRTWQREYDGGRWICTPVELGVFGRDTRVKLRDSKAFPYLKDVMRMACLRAKDRDVIVLTRCDTCLAPGITAELVRTTPAYAHRSLWAKEGLTYHPAVDLFAMTKEFWLAHEKELPDLVLGVDFVWHQVLAVWLEKHAATELPMAVWRKAA